MGVDKEELSSRCTKTFTGHFLKSGVTNLSTFKAELPSHCSSTAVYDIPFASAEYLLLCNVKKHFQILLRATESRWWVTYCSQATYYEMWMDYISIQSMSSLSLASALNQPPLFSILFVPLLGCVTLRQQSWEFQLKPASMHVSECMHLYLKTSLHAPFCILWFGLILRLFRTPICVPGAW